MSLTEFRGLPSHVLLVHLLVVLVPVAAVTVLIAAWWPRGRQRLGFAPMLVAFLALATVPLTTHAGEWLKERVGQTPLVERHAHLGGQLLPWVIGLFVVSVVVWAVGRQLDRSSARADVPGARGGGGDGGTDGGTDGGKASQRRLLGLGVALVASVLAVGSIVQTVRIGESGSKAVWQGNFSDQPR